LPFAGRSPRIAAPNDAREPESMPDDQTTAAAMAPGSTRELPTSETIEVLANRISIRQFTDRPVDDAHVEAVLRAAFRAPTSSNIQSYSVVVVRDRETLARIAPITRNQKHVIEAPVFLAFCADLSRIDHALTERGKTLDGNNLEVGLVSSIDASLVGMSAYLAADSLGLKGVMIGAVRNDAVATAEILGLPHRAYCVFGMVLGWPAEAPQQKPRMEYADVVHYERYGSLRGGRATPEAVAAYDAALAAHYASVGKPTTPDSWSHDMVAKFDPKVRADLRRGLEQLGFDFS